MLELRAWNKDTDTIILPERLPTDLEWARFPNGVKKQYVEPVEPVPAIPVIVTSITGDIQHKSDFSLVTCYELASMVITGTLAVPDRVFSLPVKRDDGRLFLFAAAVVNGQFSVTINFPTSGVLTCTDAEVNKDLPDNTFSIAPMQFDVLRKVS